MSLFVLLLVGIDILILTIFLVVEGVSNRLDDIKVVQDRENPMSTEGVRIYIVSKIDNYHTQSNTTHGKKIISILKKRAFSGKDRQLLQTL